MRYLAIIFTSFCVVGISYLARKRSLALIFTTLLLGISYAGYYLGLTEMKNIGVLPLLSVNVAVQGPSLLLINCEAIITISGLLSYRYIRSFSVFRERRSE